MASKTRGKVWSENETKHLLTCWSEETVQIALDNSKCTKDTNRVYRNLLVRSLRTFFLSFLPDI